MRKKFVLLFLVIAVVCVLTACKAKTFSVTFDPQNGAERQTIPFDSNFALPQTPTNAGFSFGGWFCDSACTDGNEWQLPQSLSNDITVYAKWTPLPAEIDLSQVLLPFQDSANWNFQISYAVEREFVGGAKDSHTEVLRFSGETYSVQFVQNGKTLCNFVAQSDSGEPMFYIDDGNGKYSLVTPTSANYDALLESVPYVNLSALCNLSFTAVGTSFFANDSQNAAEIVLNKEGCTGFCLVVSDKKPTTLTAICQTDNETTTYVLTFDSYGEVKISLPEVQSDDPIDPCKNGHTWDSWTTTTVATCLSEGEMARSCSVCGAQETQTIAKTVHTWGSWTTKTAATCVQEGTDVRTCSVCGTQETQSVSKTAHTWGSWKVTISATCLSEGEMARSCSVCGAQETQTIAKTVHTWGSWTTKTAATCVQEGTDVRTCSVCGIQETQSVAKIAHTYVNGVCTLCGDKISGSDPDLSAVFQQYADHQNWNFRVTYVMTNSYGEYFYDDVLRFDGENLTMEYTDADGVTYTDVLLYDTAKAQYAYYLDNGDGTYTCYFSRDNAAEFEVCYGYVDYIKLSTLANFEFYANGDCFSATNPNAAGNEIFGQWEDCTWTSVDIFVDNGKISQIVALQNDTSADYAGVYALSLTFDHYGEITVEAPVSSGNEGGDSDQGGDGGGTESGGNEDISLGWNNTPTTVGDAVGLQQQMVNMQYSIGLPSIGNYDCLVVPVQFSDTKVEPSDLENLNIAFNGTSEQTGWESVSTFYQKSSYGKLNLHFDILGYNIGIQNKPYVSSKSSAFYGNLKDSNGTANGDQTLIGEILEYLSQQSIDLSHYDSNNDGVIDAIYVIYSCDVNYTSDDSLWWAYVYEYAEFNATFQNLYADYYLFAGMDFMFEDVYGGNIQSGEIDGLKINAATYIHETGHLLGLDDYYDYDTSLGSNRGLGGADMMDATVGDHNAYSKIMMGWLTPQKITSTTTFTLDISDTDVTNDCALISLDNTNSEFGEYLLIDLYAATGLNSLHASLVDSLLYEGEPFGARIFHVSSSCNNPYKDDGYSSFTDNNNSVSDVALLMLVEADGWPSSTAENNGLWASAKDLWQTGDSLQQIYPGYVDYSNNSICFDVLFEEVTSTTATVTVTFVGQN